MAEGDGNGAEFIAYSSSVLGTHLLAPFSAIPL